MVEEEAGCDCGAWGRHRCYHQSRHCHFSNSNQQKEGAKVKTETPTMPRQRDGSLLPTFHPSTQPTQQHIVKPQPNFNAWFQLQDRLLFNDSLRRSVLVQRKLQDVEHGPRSILPHINHCRSPPTPAYSTSSSCRRNKAAPALEAQNYLQPQPQQQTQQQISNQWLYAAQGLTIHPVQASTLEEDGLYDATPPRRDTLCWGLRHLL